MKDDAPNYNVVAYDFGIKQNILRRLVGESCSVTVVPATTSAEDVLAMKPDGVFLSNGPGDPEPVTYAQDNIRRMMGKVPSSASASATSSSGSPWAARPTS